MLANLNQHFTAPDVSYSALWGYHATNGREYAILGCYTGTAFIDITDSLNIREVDFLPNTNPSSNGNLWREMKTYSHYAYIVSEADNSNIQIVDLQYLPDSVRYVGKFDLPMHSTTHSVSQSGQYLFLNGCNTEFTQGIAVLDLANPEVPLLRGKWNEFYVHDSRIVNDTIWACNISSGRVSIISAIDKDSLFTIRNWVNNPVPNAPHNIAFSGNRQFSYVTDETITPSPGKMKVWDVSDISNLTYVRSVSVFPFEHSVVHNAETYGNIAVIAYYTAGVKVFDISEPSNPIEIAWYDTYSKNNGAFYDGCWGVFMFGSGKIVASDQNNGLFVLRAELTSPVVHLPVCNFSASQLEIRRNDTIRLIDASSGIPSSWQWRITGPESRTSVQKNPDLTFYSIGQYSVSLGVSNSLGSDSLTRTNLFKVIPQQLGSFSIVTPLLTPYYRILTSPDDTSKVLFSWSRSAQDTSFRYKVYFRKIQGSGEIYLSTGNYGRDSSMLISKGTLDSIALHLGLTGDSVLISFRTKAYNGVDSLFSVNSSIIVLRRTSVGIQNISSLVPSEYRLFDNYPNPFNPSTNIEFDIPKRSAVRLTLFDITGKETVALIDEELEAGRYKYTLNLIQLLAGQTNSGVYFARFVAGNYTSVKRIILLK